VIDKLEKSGVFIDGDTDNDTAIRDIEEKLNEVIDAINSSNKRLDELSNRLARIEHVVRRETGRMC